MLIDHVKAIVDEVIADKIKRHISPAYCSQYELMTRLSFDALECMRELYRSGEYIGTKNVNEVPMLLKNDKNQLNEKTNV